MLDRVITHEYPVNWKTFIEVYLEDYHVGPFHPGLGQFVNADDLKWEFGDWYSVQTVGLNQALGKPGTAAYQKWHEAVLRLQQRRDAETRCDLADVLPERDGEWYPNVLVVSTILPRDPEHCTNIVEFYYPEDIVLFEREFVQAEQQAYTETAREDEEICVRMTEGRRALHQQHRNEFGPYQSPMEDGMIHFHEFVRTRIQSHL